MKPNKSKVFVTYRFQRAAPSSAGYNLHQIRIPWILQYAVNTVYADEVNINFNGFNTDDVDVDWILRIKGTVKR